MLDGATFNGNWASAGDGGQGVNGAPAFGGAIGVFSNAASLDIKNSEFINNDAIGPEWWTVWPTT